MAILGHKTPDGELNPDVDIYEASHSPSSYHCSVPLPLLDIHGGFGSDHLLGLALEGTSTRSHGAAMSSSESIQHVT